MPLPFHNSGSAPGKERLLSLISAHYHTLYHRHICKKQKLIYSTCQTKVHHKQVEDGNISDWKSDQRNCLDSNTTKFKSGLNNFLKTMLKKGNLQWLQPLQWELIATSAMSIDLTRSKGPTLLLPASGLPLVKVEPSHIKRPMTSPWVVVATSMIPALPALQEVGTSKTKAPTALHPARKTAAEPFCTQREVLSTLQRQVVA